MQDEVREIAQRALRNTLVLASDGALGVRRSLVRQTDDGVGLPDER